PSGCLRVLTTAAESDDGERQELPAGRPDLDLRALRRADAAVVAGRPPAVVDLDPADRVLPVGPHPVLVEPGVEVVPRQHLGEVALAGGVPVEAHRCAGEDLGRAPLPALEGEVLAPAVEAAAVLPHPADDRADATVAARQQSFDDR